MRRRHFLAVVASAGVARPFAGIGQPLGMPKVGVLATDDLQAANHLLGLQEELRRLGYVEGQNIRFEFRSAQGDLDRLPEIAGELVQANVDVMVAPITPAAFAARRATSSIPIVMTYVADPVGMGLAASLAQPGGNITGLAAMGLELATKHVELLAEAVPSATRFAALCNAPDPYSKPLLEQIRQAGEVYKLGILPFMVAAGAELDAAFSKMVHEKVDGVIVQGSLQATSAADLALMHRLPTISQGPQFARRGGLMSYFSSLPHHIRRAAAFVDKILKGAKPTDLPIEQPTHFEFVINMRTAHALGLTVPLSLLARADEVIE